MKKMTRSKFSKQVDIVIRDVFGSSAKGSDDTEILSGDRYVRILNVTTNIGGLVGTNIVGYFGFLSVGKIYQYFLSPRPETRHLVNATHVAASYEGFRQNRLARITCETEADLSQALEAVRAYLKDELKPFFDAITTPDKLMDLFIGREHLLSRDTVPQWGDWDDPLKLLVCVRLYRPAHYEALKAHYRPIYRSGFVTDPMNRQIDQLLNYLDQKELGDLPKLLEE